MSEPARSVAEELEEKNREFADLYAAREIERMVERFYTNDAVVIAPEQPLVRSTADICALFRSYAENFSRVEMHPVLTAVQDSIAYQLVNATLYERHSGSAMPVRYVTIFRRERDGWRCALDFFGFGHLSGGERQS